MISSSATPVVTSVVTFVDAVFNLLVLVGVVTVTPEQLAAVNTVLLSAFALIAALRAGAQHNGTLVQTAKPDPAPPS